MNDDPAFLQMFIERKRQERTIFHKFKKNKRKNDELRETNNN